MPLVTDGPPARFSPVPAPLLVVIVTTAGSTLASTPRTSLALLTAGAGVFAAPFDADVVTLDGLVIVFVLVPRVVTATPPPTPAPITAATTATTHIGVGFLLRSLASAVGGGGGGGEAGASAASCHQGQTGESCELEECMVSIELNDA